MTYLTLAVLLLSVGLFGLAVVHLKLRRKLWRIVEFLGESESKKIGPLSSREAFDLLRDRVVAQAKQMRRATISGNVLGGLLDELDHALMILDTNLRLRYSNALTRLIFPNGDWKKGASLIQAVHDHRFERIARESFGTGLRRSGRVLMSGQSREPTTYQVECGVLPEEGGGGGVWMLIRDISAQESADQVRKDFVANASHELRTPLTLIRGYLEMLIDDGGADAAAVVRSAGIMRKHSVRLERIVEDMLTISRLENDGSSVSLEPFDFTDCVKDVSAHVRHLFPNRELDLQADIQLGPDFMGDRFLWEQILSNLMENACKENPERDIKVIVSATQIDGNSVVRVTDNGIGIPRTDLPHIFRRFYRGSKTPIRKGVKGTGLGLSIVRHAVEAQGGKIEASSTPGVATTFTITLPRNPTIS